MQTKSVIAPFKLYYLLIITGFVTVVTMVVTLKQLHLMTGNHDTFTALMLGSLLISLGFGFWYGGNYTKSVYHQLKRSIIIASIVFSIGLSSIVINLLGHAIAYVGIEYSFIFSMLFLILMATATLFFVGQVLPLAMHFFESKTSLAQITGKALLLTAMGWCLGAIFTVLILLNIVGLAWGIFLATCLLLIACFILLKDFSYEIISVSLLASIGVVAYGFNVQLQHQQRVLMPAYLQVVDDTPKPLSQQIDYTRYNASNGYVKRLKQILFEDLQLRNQHILVLGANNFKLSDNKKNGNRFTYVEMHNKKMPSACDYLTMMTQGDRIFRTTPKVAFRAKQKYNVIITHVDSAQHSSSNGFYLLNDKFLKQVKNTLTKSGYAVFNVVGRPTLIDNHSKRVDRSIRSVFPNCMEIPLKYSNQPTNIIYVCHKSQNKAIPLGFDGPMVLR